MANTVDIKVQLDIADAIAKLQQLDNAFKGITSSASGLDSVSNSLNSIGQSAGAAAGALTDMEQEAGKSTDIMATLGSELQTVGGILTNATAPMVEFGKESTEAFYSVEQGMTIAAGIMTQQGGDMGVTFEQLKQKAMDFGKNTAFSTQEATDGILTLVRAGFTMEELDPIMASIEGAALATGQSFDQSATQIIKATAGFSDEISKAGDKTKWYSDSVAAMTAVANTADFTIGDMSESLKYVGSTMSDVGMTFEQGAGMLGVLASQGMKASQAGTGLRQMMNSLIDPTDKASGAIQKLGIDLYDAQGKMIPMPDLISQLIEKTDGLTEAEKNTALGAIFTTQGLAAFSKLANASPEYLGKLEGALGNATENMDKLKQASKDTASYGIEELEGSIETFKISVGESLAESLVPFVDATTKIVNKVTEWAQENPKLVQTIGLVVGVVALLGGALTVVGGLMVLISVVSGLTFGPFILGALAAIAIIGVLVGAFIIFKDDILKMVENIKKAWSDFTKSMSDKWTEFCNKIKELIQPVVDWFKSAWESVVNWWNEFTNSLKEGWNSFTEWMKELISSIVDWFKLKWEQAKEFMSAFGDFMGSIWELIKTTIQASLDFVSELLKTLWENLAPQWLQTFFDKVVEVWNAIPEYIQEAWTWITDIMQEGVDTLSRMWTFVKDFADSIWTAISDFVTGVWDKIKAKALEVADSINEFTLSVYNWFSDKYNAMKTKATEVWNSIKNKVTETANSIKEKITEIWNKFKENFESIKKKGEDVWNSIKNLGPKAFDEVKKAAERFWENLKKEFPIVGGLVSTFSKAVGTITNAFNSVKDAASNALQKAKDLFNFNSKNPPKKASLDGPLGPGIPIVASDAIYAEASASAFPITAGLMDEPLGMATSGMNPNSLVSVANMTVRDENDIQKIAVELQRLLMRQMRGKGVPSNSLYVSQP